MCASVSMCFFLCYEAKVMGTEAFVRAAAVKKERSSIGRCFNKTKKQKERKKERSYSHIFGVERFLKCIFVVARTSLKELTSSSTAT